MRTQSFALTMTAASFFMLQRLVTTKQIAYFLVWKVKHPARDMPFIRKNARRRFAGIFATRRRSLANPRRLQI